MANIGYIRVSTIEQNEGRQLKAMEDKGIDKLFIDKCSGKDMNRPQLQNLIDYAREGDTIHIESFSRLARSTKDLLGLIEDFKTKGINVISFKENLDTNTPTGKLMLTMMGAIGEFERECLLERQREGIAIAKAEGKYKGRKEIDYPSNWIEVYNQYKVRDITGTKAMELLELKRNTFYKLIKKYESEVE